MAEDKPHLKYDHVFAIIRVDDFHDLEVSPETKITITKIVLTRETAEAEVARLNKLNSNKGCIYFYTITRIER